MFSAFISPVNHRPDCQMKAGFGTSARRGHGLKADSETLADHYKNNSFSGNKNASYISFIPLGRVQTYQYDDAGNLTQKTEAGTNGAKVTQNRLIEVADATAGSSAIQRKSIAKYGYDPLGRRIWKEQYRDSNATPLTQAKRTIYLYADEGLIAEATQAIIVAANASGVQTVTASAAPAITTQYGPTPNSPFGTGALFIKTKNSNNTDTIAYYHHDHLQTPIQATDKAGNIVWAASYDAFGKASIITPAATADKPTIESNLRLPGQYEDQETGLHYNYFRYLDTQTGRYITQDPIGLAGGVNRYSYVNGNPMNLFDPMGLAVYGGNGNNFGDIPPTEGCRTPIWAGGFIMGWKPCDPPKPPNPRPPTPSPLGGSCEAPQERSAPQRPNSQPGDDSNSSGGMPPNRPPFFVPEIGVNGQVGGFAGGGCMASAGVSYSNSQGGGLNGYVGCGVGLGALAAAGAGGGSLNFGDPTGWGVNLNFGLGALWGGSANAFVTNTGIAIDFNYGMASGAAASLTTGIRGTR